MSNVINNPLPWHSKKQDSSIYSHEEIDKLIVPSDRFENLLNDNIERKPEIFVPIDSHHFDEEDYRNHRHRVYPHMHQPLKSMEPHLLRKIKEKIRDNKKAQLKAATAGVPTSVPQLLASSTDSRVLISSSNSGRVISGPVLGLVKSEEPPTSESPTNTDCIEINKYNESAVIPALGGRKKRKRKRRRSKKQEPFQPTLGKLSEESSSPINSANEVDRFSGIMDDFDEEFEDECDDGGMFEQGALVLEELCSVVNADKAIEDIAMDSLGFNYLQKTEVKPIPFLEEISSTDQPIGFLDMTLQRKTM